MARCTASSMLVSDEPTSSTTLGATLGDLLHPPGTPTGAHVLRDAADAQRSRVLQLSIPAPNEGVSRGTTYVYLPPGYDQPANADARYPVVYLIHGYPGRAQDWFTAGGVKSTMDLLIRDYYIGPMIVVSVRKMWW